MRAAAGKTIRKESKEGRVNIHMHQNEPVVVHQRDRVKKLGAQIYEVGLQLDKIEHDIHMPCQSVSFPLYVGKVELYYIHTLTVMFGGLLWTRSFSEPWLVCLLSVQMPFKKKDNAMFQPPTLERYRGRACQDRKTREFGKVAVYSLNKPKCPLTPLVGARPLARPSKVSASAT